MSTTTHTPATDDVVIVAARRTPQGKLLGAFASLTAVDLATTAAVATIEDATAAATAAGNTFTPGDIDYVVLGQVLLAGAGQNPARQVAVKAGIPLSVPAEIVNKVCLSGLDAIIHGTRMIRAGDARIVLAGGMESMTGAPHIVAGARAGRGYGDLKLVDAINRDGLYDAQTGDTMGAQTDNGNGPRGITREEQDALAAASHQRAATAAEAGIFTAEIAPVTVPQRRGEPITVTADEGIRPETTVETLARLRPAFIPDGTITAASSSQISDGAAIVLLTTREEAEARGFKILATIVSYGQTAGPDTAELHSQPSIALKAALAKAGLEVEDLSMIEINEAFAAVVIQTARDLGVDPAKINEHGGGISLGHPVGASGARLVVHAAHDLNRRKAESAGETLYAGAALCGGGGQGDAIVLAV